MLPQKPLLISSRKALAFAERLCSQVFCSGDSSGVVVGGGAMVTVTVLRQGFDLSKSFGFKMKRVVVEGEGESVGVGVGDGED